jgi:hypothetical protein
VTRPAGGVLFASIALLAVCPPLHASELDRIVNEPYGRWTFRSGDLPETPPAAPVSTEPEPDARDRRGLRRDTYYFLAYQFAVIGILYVLPEDFSGWSEEQKSEYSLSIWWDNVTHPQWDSDDFYLNYILHPYWGAAYFVRARERGYPASASFWYSALLSAMYEFGAEALFEEPSIQDLVVTPVFGSLLGTYFMRVRDGIDQRATARGYRSTGDKWVLALTDPLGSLNRMFDGLFGWEEAAVQLQPYYRLRPTARPWQPPHTAGADDEYGIRLTIAWQ